MWIRRFFKNIFSLFSHQGHLIHFFENYWFCRKSGNDASSVERWWEAGGRGNGGGGERERVEGTYYLRHYEVRHIEVSMTLRSSLKTIMNLQSVTKRMGKSIIPTILPSSPLPSLQYCKKKTNTCITLDVLTTLNRQIEAWNSYFSTTFFL